MKFFSDISIWLLIPLGVAAFIIAYYFYYKQKQLTEFSKKKKWILVSLRACSLFVLGLLLFGIILEHKEYKTEKPVFITLVDNSSSMLNYKDSNLVANSIEKFNGELKNRFGDRFQFENIQVGKEVISGKPNYESLESNLNEGFKYIYEKYYNSNVGGVCFISDGNFNSGVSPVYASKKIELTPIFTVGVGDTIVKRDQFVRNVAVNNIAFYKNKFPIDINIEAHRMAGTSSKVSIWKGDKRIKEEIINYGENEIDFKSILFELEANEVGFVEYTVKLDDVENESSYENNSRKFYLEVIDSRSKVLLLAKAPHPDITAIRQELEKDDNIEVESKLTSEWSGELNDISLVIVHNPTMEERLLNEKIENSATPILYIFGSQTSTDFVKAVNLGLKYPSGQRVDEVQASLNNEFQMFEVSDELKRSIQKWPPLSVRFGEISTTSGTVMISQKIGAVTKKDPILFFGKKQNRKYGVLIGEGLWRWRMLDFLEFKNTKAFNELIQKITQYLIVQRNNEPLRITLPKRYLSTKDVVINAAFYNESFEQIISPAISLKLSREGKDKLNYEFAKIGNSYVLSIGKLTPGKYSFEASTKHNGKSYNKTGVFVVEDISLEALSSNANHNVLNQIAKNSNGGFYTLNQLDKLISDIEKRKDIVNITYEESNFDDLVDWKWLCGLLILMLGGEWFIRRQGGTY